MKRTPLIMLPGWGMDKYVWMLMQNTLENFFELFYVDWRGICSVSCFKDRVVQLVTTKKMSSFSLLGWSLGSLVALDIMSEYQLQVKYGILIGATSRFTTDGADGYNAGWPQKIVERMKFQLKRKKEKTLLDFYTAMFSSTEKASGFDRNFLQLVKKKFYGDEILSLSIGLDYLIQMDFREKLSVIKSPLLLIHGDQDQISPLSASEFVYKKVLKEAHFKILPGVGHMPFFTNPDKCLTYIKCFIKEGNYND